MSIPQLHIFLACVQGYSDANHLAKSKILTNCLSLVLGKRVNHVRVVDYTNIVTEISLETDVQVSFKKVTT